MFAAGGLGLLEDADLSLRPSASGLCSAWLPALLRALPGMPALARLAMKRWILGPRERRQLSHSLRRRKRTDAVLLLEWDPDLKEAASGSDQENPEEIRSEE